MRILMRALPLLSLALLAAGSAGCAVSDALPSINNSTAKNNNMDRMLSLARLSERHGKLPEAAKLYHAILQTNPNHAVALHRLGVIAARSGDHKRALTHFDQARRSGTPSAELLADIGYTQYLLDDLGEAESSLRAALQLDPQYKKARNNLGMVLAEQGREDESFAEFRKAGGESAAHVNVAYVKTQLGEMDEAERHYHRSLELDNNQRQAAEALIQLAEHRDAYRRVAARRDAAPTTSVRGDPRDVIIEDGQAQPAVSISPSAQTASPQRAAPDASRQAQLPRRVADPLATEQTRNTEPVRRKSPPARWISYPAQADQRLQNEPGRGTATPNLPHAERTQPATRAPAAEDRYVQRATQAPMDAQLVERFVQRDTQAPMDAEFEQPLASRGTQAASKVQLTDRYVQRDDQLEERYSRRATQAPMMDAQREERYSRRATQAPMVDAQREERHVQRATQAPMDAPLEQRPVQRVEQARIQQRPAEAPVESTPAPRWAEGPPPQPRSMDLPEEKELETDLPRWVAGPAPRPRPVRAARRDEADFLARQPAPVHARKRSRLAVRQVPEYVPRPDFLGPEEEAEADLYDDRLPPMQPLR